MGAHRFGLIRVGEGLGEVEDRGGGTNQTSGGRTVSGGAGECDP